MIRRFSHAPGQPRLAALRPAALLLAFGLPLWGCAVPVDPVTDAERQRRVQTDQAAMFVNQSPVSRPFSVYDAMARAIKYNHEHRLRAMEAALALGLAEISSYDLLPQVTTSAGYTARSNELMSTSQTNTTPSISEEKQRVTANLGVAWNVLDFGVNYLRARQQSNQALIAEERRRKVVHTIIQQVRSAYWRAVAADRLESDLDPLIRRIEDALATAHKIEEKRLQAPTQTLDYKRALLDTLRQLQLLRRDIASARLELAGLMNLPSNQTLTLAPTDSSAAELPKLAISLSQLEPLALLNRPELREEDYQARISADEISKSFAKMLPGLSLDFAESYDSNKFLVNHLWAEGGVRLAWNLINLASGPAAISQARSQAAFVDMRRRAMHMAVLTQVRIGYLREMEAADEFKVADDLSKTDERLFTLARAGTAAAASDELELIRRDANRLFSRARRDLSYAELQNAIGSLGVAVGIDPLPAELASADVDVLAQGLQRTLGDWDNGRMSLPTLPPAALPPAAGTETITVPAPVATSSLADPLDGLSLLPGASSRAALPAASADETPQRSAPANKPTHHRSAPAMETAPAPESAPAPSGTALLQLGSFRERDNALSEWNDLARIAPGLKSYQPEIVSAGTFHVLYARGSADSLQSLCTQLKSRSHDCILRDGRS